MNSDKPIILHNSISELLICFRNVIAAMTWFKVSVNKAEQFFKSYPYIIELPCSVTGKIVKIDKTILKLVRDEGFDGLIPIYSKSLINFYRIFTIAVKDIIWKEPNFSSLLKEPELQFLRHLRNASAHNNFFFWGKGKNRKIPEPIIWRGKEIKKDLEHTKLYMEFMKPGDLFILLSDISKLNSKE